MCATEKALLNNRKTEQALSMTLKRTTLYIAALYVILKCGRIRPNVALQREKKKNEKGMRTHAGAFQEQKLSTEALWCLIHVLSVLSVLSILSIYVSMMVLVPSWCWCVLCAV